MATPDELRRFAAYCLSAAGYARSGQLRWEHQISRMDEEEIERQILQEVKAHWRDFVISRVVELNGQSVGELPLVALEWVDKSWMPKIRRRWFSVELEIKRHYIALECAL